MPLQWAYFAFEVALFLPIDAKKQNAFESCKPVIIVQAVSIDLTRISNTRNEFEYITGRQRDEHKIGQYCKNGADITGTCSRVHLPAYGRNKHWFCHCHFYLINGYLHP